MPASQMLHDATVTMMFPLFLLWVQSRLQIDGEIIETAVSIQLDHSSPKRATRITELPGYLRSIPVAVADKCCAGLFRAPNGVAADFKLAYFSMLCCCGRRVVKLVMGQVPHGLTPDQIAYMVQAVSGVIPLAVETQDAASAKRGSGGRLRFVFVEAFHAPAIIESMHRRCVFVGDELHLFKSGHVVAPRLWCQAARELAAAIAERNAEPRPIEEDGDAAATAAPQPQPQPSTEQQPSHRATVLYPVTVAYASKA